MNPNDRPPKNVFAVIDEARQDISNYKVCIEQGRYELSDVCFLLSRMEDLNSLTGEVEETEFNEIRSILRDVTEVTEATEIAAEHWANTCEIVVKPIPQNVAEIAASDFGRERVNELGVRAYIRHRLTNYDSLRQEAMRLGFLDHAYQTLRMRVELAIDSCVN